MNRIKLLRTLNGMKQAELAKKILVSQSSISGYENGQFEPDSKTLLKIADLFHVSVDYLLGMDHPASSENELKGIPVYRHIQNNLQVKLPITLYYQELNPCKFGPEEYFGLYMEKDYMEPRICAGDLVIVRKQEEVPSGSIVAVQIGKQEAVVKKLCKLANGEMVFLSYNTKYEPDCFTTDQITSLPVQILGIVVEFYGITK